MSRQRKTHCTRGHERTSENTGTRGQCRICGGILKKEQYHSDPDFKARVLRQQRLRYATSARARADAIKRNAAWRERQMTDPQRAAALREAGKLKAESRRRADAVAPRTLRRPRPLPRPKEELMDARPIIAWLDAWVKGHPYSSEHKLCTDSRVPPKVVTRVREGESTTMALDFIDKILVGAGQPPTTLHALYPIKRLVDDGTGNFGLEFDGEPGAQCDVAFPEPATAKPRAPWLPNDYEPDWSTYEPGMREMLQRLRAQVGPKFNKSLQDTGPKL